MDENLSKLIRDYQRRVSEAVGMLEANGISRPSSNIQWATNGVKGRGLLPDGFTYYKHGYACAVDGPAWSVDFDFGDAGQIDGFDAWRLFDFARKRLGEYGFESEEEIKSAVELAATAGELVYSGNILYYVTEVGRSDTRGGAG